MICECAWARTAYQKSEEKKNVQFESMQCTMLYVCGSVQCLALSRSTHIYNFSFFFVVVSLLLLIRFEINLIFHFLFFNFIHLWVCNALFSIELKSKTKEETAGGTANCIIFLSCAMASALLLWPLLFNAFGTRKTHGRIASPTFF